MNGANLPSLLGTFPDAPAGVPRVARLAGVAYGLVRPRRGLKRSLSALSFWGAIALPAVYLPLLLAGIDTPDGLSTFLVLFGLHVVALVAGRRYRRPAGP